MHSKIAPSFGESETVQKRRQKLGRKSPQAARRGGGLEAHAKFDHLERALAIMSREDCAVGLNLSTALINYMYGNDCADLREELERVLAIEEHEYGPDHSIALTNLGIAHDYPGNDANTRDVLGRAQEILEREDGFDLIIDHDASHATVGTLFNLSAVPGPLGDAVKVCDTLERELEVMERAYGPDHPQVAATLQILAGACDALGDAAQARALLERAIDIQERGSYVWPERRRPSARRATLPRRRSTKKSTC